MSRLLLFILAIVAFTTSHSRAQAYFNTKGVALRGYDVVAYFIKSEPVRGSEELTHSWRGSIWQFSSKENLEAFKLNPEKYAPQYGGYCAYGVSENHKSPTDPNAFTILDDKLYLNYNQKVKEIWSKDTKGFVEKAEIFWPQLKDQKE